VVGRGPTVCSELVFGGGLVFFMLLCWGVLLLVGLGGVWVLAGVVLIVGVCWSVWVKGWLLWGWLVSVRIIVRFGTVVFAVTEAHCRQGGVGSGQSGVCVACLGLVEACGQGVGVWFSSC